ncbi:MAG: Ig-like domain-containing protein [Planctomycetota bacterium]
MNRTSQLVASIFALSCSMNAAGESGVPAGRGLNSAPIANPDAVNLEFRETVDFDVLSNDSDAESTVEIVSFSQPANGTVTLLNATPGGAQFRFEPDPGFFGTDSFEYFIRDAPGLFAGAMVTLHVELLEGDAAESAFEVTAIPFSDSGDLDAGNNLYVEPNASGWSGGPDRVYRYIAPDSRDLRISLCGSSTDLVGLYVYREVPPFLALAPRVTDSFFASGDEFCDFVFPGTIADLRIDAGWTYYIVVDSAGFGAPGETYEIDIDFAPVPPGDTCETAYVIDSLPYLSVEEPPSFDADYDVSCSSPFDAEVFDAVYQYTPLSDELIRVEVATNGSWDADVTIWTSDGPLTCSDFLSQVACSDSPCFRSEPEATACIPAFSARAGVTYSIFVSTNDESTSGFYRLTVEREPGDVCEAPFEITSLPFSVNGNNEFLSDDYRVTDCGGAIPSIGGRDIVYRFVPEFTMDVDISTCRGSTFDTVLYVFEGDCAFNSDVYACNDDGCASLRSEINGLTLFAGREYFIVVDSWANETGVFILDVERSEPTGCPQFHPTPFTYTTSNQGLAPTAPQGSVVLGDVPFEIPIGTNNVWSSSSTSGPTQVAMNTSVDNVTGIHLLLNTAWGNNGLQIADVILTFADSSTHTFDLLNGVDIRDWRSPSNHSNNTTNPNSQEVWRGPNNFGDEMVIDKLFLPVPEALRTLELTEIRLTDQFFSNVHTARLQGVTIERACSECPGDVDGDGETDTADITLVVSNLGAGAPGATGTPGDADGDGETDTADITFVVSNLGCTSE